MITLEQTISRQPIRLQSKNISVFQEEDVIAAFEASFANYVGVNGALAVQSGTAAIHLALQLLEVSKGDHVFCSTLSSIASANPIVYQHAVPVFIDVEPDTWNMSPLALEKALDHASREHSLPKAVIVTNIYGHPAQINELVEICNHFQAPIIEDASHSLASTYQGRQTGTFGLFGAYSFGPGKMLAASGGGMLVSNDVTYMETAKTLSSLDCENEPFHHHRHIGYSYRMSELVAKLGLDQLQVLRQSVALKREIFTNYKHQLANQSDVYFQEEQEGTCSNRWASVVLMENVNIEKLFQVILMLENKNIQTSFMFKPLHMQPIFKDCSFFSEEDEMCVALMLFRKGLCLPSSSDLTENDQQFVIDQFRQALKIVRI